MLGPQLFTIYINDLEEGTEGTVAKFADDTKIYRGTGSIEKQGGAKGLGQVRRVDKEVADGIQCGKV